MKWNHSLRPFLSLGLALGLALPACSARGIGGGGTTSTDGGKPPTDTGAPDRGAGETTLDPCADALDCAACTGRSACGWCAGRCWQGSGSGPTGATCGESPWAWNSPQCVSTPDAGVTIGAACQSCALSMCGAQAAACSGESACIPCITAPTQACLSNSRFAALAECACGGCAEACGSLCVIR